MFHNKKVKRSFRQRALLLDWHKLNENYKSSGERGGAMRTTLMILGALLAPLLLTGCECTGPECVVTCSGANCDDTGDTDTDEPGMGKLKVTVIDTTTQLEDKTTDIVVVSETDTVGNEIYATSGEVLTLTVDTYRTAAGNRDVLVDGIETWVNANEIRLVARPDQADVIEGNEPTEVTLCGIPAIKGDYDCDAYGDGEYFYTYELKDIETEKGYILQHPKMLGDDLLEWNNCDTLPTLTRQGSQVLSFEAFPNGDYSFSYRSENEEVNSFECRLQ